MKKITNRRKKIRTTRITLNKRLVALFTFSVISLSACAETVLQGDIERGKEMSGVCGMCHGDNGISLIPIYPNLAGQKEQYLVLQLRAFRSGERVNMAMTSHAQKLTDQDIADLSAYYAQLDPKPE
jgi:cytochrome c553